MDFFRTTLTLPVGTRLAGFADRIDVPTTAPGRLEAHGLRLTDPATGAPWEFIALDALYAGALVTRCRLPTGRRVFAASHTHYAPMLDPTKPRLGHVDEAALEAWAHGLETAPRRSETPDRCVIWCADVPVPVYRRFDHPDSRLNRLLTARAGFYPNAVHPLERRLYLIILMAGPRAVGSLAYHACHPTSRADAAAVSPDYIGAIRAAVQERFGIDHMLFLLGCTGDVRPNLACKRTNLLPRNRLNWRFRSPPTAGDQAWVDGEYRRAVQSATQLDAFDLADAAPRVGVSRLPVSGLPDVEVPFLAFGDRLQLEFLPFELSHRYRLAQLRQPEGWRRLLVSCADHTHGYLPFPDQARAGGYEVDGSRPYMGLPARLGADAALC